MRMYSVQLPNDEFHKRLGGGIPVGTIGLIKGEHGSGKSVVCQRITYGLLRNDVSVTYVSTQLTTSDFISQMLSLGYDVIKDMIKMRLLFIPVYPLIQEPMRRDRFADKLMNAKELFEKDVIIIDCFSTLLRADLDENSAVKLMGFFKRLSALGKSVILTALDELEKKVMDEIEGACTFIAETSVRKFGADLKNVMMIKKYNLAGGTYSKQIAFRVEPKIGLIVEIAAVA